MFYFQEQHLVRILYKSGNSQEFWVTDFSIKNGYAGSLTYSWTTAGTCLANYPRPVSMGIDHIEAVWQLRTRKRLKFGIPPKDEK
jgi:hypothetical protein